MQSNIRILLGISLLLIGALSALYYFGADEPSKETYRAVEPVTSDSSLLATKFIEVPAIKDNEEKVSNPKNRFAYNVHYPSIGLIGHPNLAKEANTVIKTYVNDQISAFRENVADLNMDNAPRDFVSDFTMRWSTTLISPTIVSFRFDSSEYIAGSAHPNSRTSILIYDIERRTILSTSDIFASSTLALPFLSTYARTKLTNTSTEVTPEEEELIVMGTAPTAENFASVAITPLGLVVIFNPYQVAPYARGIQEVRIPYSELTQLTAKRINTAVGLASTNIREATPEAVPEDLILQ